MQFGIFSVGDVTPDPVNGTTVSEHERIRNTVEIATKAEEVDLDVFATGEHHNPPFVPSSPTTTLAYIAAQTEKLILSTSTTLITTNDPVKIAEQAAYYGDGFFHNHIFWNKEHTEAMVQLYRRRFEFYGHGAADQAYVGLGGQVFMAGSEAEAKRVFRPYFDNAPVYGHGPSLEDFTKMTPLTVGTTEQVIERTLGFADYVGDYQRQMFLIDHAGLPESLVLEQVEMLGTEVVPVLRAEFERRRPAHVPSDPPTHATLVAAGPDAPHHLVEPAREHVEKLQAEQAAQPAGASA